MAKPPRENLSPSPSAGVPFSPWVETAADVAAHHALDTAVGLTPAQVSSTPQTLNPYPKPETLNLQPFRPNR